jgi:hypothetical protein
LSTRVQTVLIGCLDLRGGIEGRGNRTKGCATLTTSKTPSLWTAAAAAMLAVCLAGFTQSWAGGPQPQFLEGARRDLAPFFADDGRYASGITRDGKPTHGDPFTKGASGGPLLPVYELELPRRVSAQGQIPGFVRRKDRASGWLVIACTGTGCAYRVPIIYTEAMLDSVRLVMAMATGKLEPESPEEEIRGLEAAAVQMEHLLAAKLATLSGRELDAYRVKGATHDPWTQDCVDQAANGASYAIVWAEYQLMRFHRPYYPGFNNGLRPHFYARLQRVTDGDVYAFDLFHRDAGIGQGTPIHAVPDPNKGA